jgi:A/G-specific adenine glycosylase
MPVDSPCIAIAEKLLRHYDAHARTLPWRAPPGANRADPYRVWLSEIMLQQTTVAAVIPYFQRFTERWPTVEALAATPDADLMAAWAGLGYYARARNLLACARAVVRDHGGQFPADEATLRTLPGVGAYTAAAVSAIAFGRRAVAVDANVERVTARLFAIDTPLPGGRVEIGRAADTITPDARAGDFAQAMMDLGSSICTTRNPACMACPLSGECAGFRAGNPADYPVKAPKKVRPQRHGHIWWIERGDHVWLEQRPAKGLLGGMRGLPTSDWSDAPDPAPPIAARWGTAAETVEHIFTHFALSLTVHRARISGTTDESDCMAGRPGEWWPHARIVEAGLPGVFAKAARRAVSIDIEEQE